MTVICPGDPVETEAAVAASMLLEGPCYFRLGKSGDKVIHEHGVDSFEIGKGIRLRQGRDLALISTGNMLETASLVHELLGTRGVESGLVSMHTVKPIDRELVAELAGTCRTIATIEEHSVIGGLGSAVAGILAELGSGARLLRFGIPDEYAPEAGSQEHLRELYGLTPHKIFGAILASTT
jgi:transketolase